MDNPARFDIRFQSWSSTITVNANAEFRVSTSLNNTTVHVPVVSTVLAFSSGGTESTSWSGCTFDGPGQVHLVSGQLTVNASTVNNLRQDSGNVDIASDTSLTVNGLFYVGGTLGTGSVLGSELIIASGGRMEFWQNAQTTPGIGFDITNNGTWVTYCTSELSFNASVAVTNNGTMTLLLPGLALTSEMMPFFFVNNGTLNVELDDNPGGGGVGLAAIDGVFTNNGTFNLKRGQLELARGGTQGALAAASTNMVGGSLKVPGQYTIGANSRLTGTGTISIVELVNNGILAPGSAATNPLGTLQITGLPGVSNSGNYTQGTTGTLQLNLAGLPTTAQFNRLLITGKASLRGTLAFTLLNNFNPPVGTTYDGLDSLITWGSLDATNNRFTTEPAGWTLTFRADGLTAVKAVGGPGGGGGET